MSIAAHISSHRDYQVPAPIKNAATPRNFSDQITPGKSAGHAAEIHGDGAKPRSRRGDLDWSSYPFEYLIRRVLEKQHETIKQQLLRLRQETGGENSRAAEKNRRGGRVRAQLAILFDNLLAEMEEEERVFPDLLHLEQAYLGELPGYSRHLKNVLEHLIHQNDHSLTKLDRIRQEAACPDRSRIPEIGPHLCCQLGMLQSALLDHLHLEHDIVFPRAAGMEAELFRYRN